jgi:hypothetical protein
MDIFKDEISKELNKIDIKLKDGAVLNEDDLKIILLNLLEEEDSNERQER